MRMNNKKFFELAKANGFEAADVKQSKNHSLSISVYHKEIDSYSENNSEVVIARGILNGKFGGASTEIIDKSTPEFLINAIKDSASYIETDDPSIIFKGSKKYHHKKLFDNSIFEKPVSEKIDLLFDIEKRLYAYDKRINEVCSVAYSEDASENLLENSYGLKLKSKMASISLFAEVTAKQGDEIRTGYHVFSGLSFSELDIDKFVKMVAEEALNKLGSTQCKSKNYPVILSPNVASTLLSVYLKSADAEDVQKNSSLFVGKLNQPVASKKLTVIENPLEKNVFFSSFDDEGVATSKRTLINKGVLTTYLYTLETAAKAGVEPTGHASCGSGKASATRGYCIVKPGKLSEEQMMADIKEGVYITSLEGLHSGMNPKSGNFSLQCEGFMIRDGKKAEPLSLITVAGNLVKMFNDIKSIGNNTDIKYNVMSCPSIRIKKLSISGK